MAKVLKIQSDKHANCVDCGAEWWDWDCEARAKRHADETGHCPTLHVQYDLHPTPPEQKG